MILFPHTALLAIVLSLLGYGPDLPHRTTFSSRYLTCNAAADPTATFDTCAVYDRQTFAPPLFGTVEHVDGHTAFAIIRAAKEEEDEQTAAAVINPAAGQSLFKSPASPSRHSPRLSTVNTTSVFPALPTFSSLPFLPPPATVTASNDTSASTTARYHVLVLHGATDPFSLHLLPRLDALARLFPRIRFLAVDCSEGKEDLYAFHRLINTSVTLPLPFISPSPPASPPPSSSTSTSASGDSSWLSWLSELLYFPSLSDWWSSAPPLPAPPAAAPSLSFSSHYLVRGLPTLLLFHAATVQQPNAKWPRSLTHLAQHIAHATHSPQAQLGEEAVDGDGEDGEWGGEWEEDWEELFDVTNELDWGLLFGVLGMSVVHWLHRLKDRLDRWEVEAIAVQHAAM